MTPEAMNPRKEPTGDEGLVETLGDHLRRRVPPTLEEQLVLDRVWSEMRQQSADVPVEVLDHFRPEQAASARRGFPRLAVAAAALLALAISAAVVRLWLAPGGNVLARIEAVDGTLYRGSGPGAHTLAAGDGVRLNEILRTNGGAGAQLVLNDGSRVEMRSQSKLSLERADDGARIHLVSGSVIVNAAKQRSGHLYVQTKDVTVSVVGTVFLVDAEEEGSRVAVIEGEVRVQQGAAEKTLLPGEQMATGPKASSPLLTEAFAWSRSADEHRAQLQQFAVAAPELPAQDVSQEKFDVESIRRSTVQPGDSGRSGGGGGGVSRRNRRGDNPCSLGGEPVVDPRRFDAVNVTLVQLVSWAYGLDCWMNRGPDVLFGGPPDWIRKDGYDVVAGIPEGAPSYTMSQLRAHEAPALQRMLHSMLVSRFKLATRREMREMPVYVLSVAKDGPKYTKVNQEGRWTDLKGNPLDKPQVISGATVPGRREPPADRANPEFSIWVDGDDRNFQQLGNSEIHGRRRTVGELARILSLYTGRPVLDRTKLTGLFNYFFEFAVMECATCPFTAPAPDAPREPGGGPPPDTPLFRVLEQVGLELKPSREQVEVLVIERVERPTEN